MAKGLTSAPLVIWVAAEWFNRPEILALMSDGHRVISMGMPALLVTEPDLILHRAAHAWSDEFWDYLPAALKSVRERKRRRKG